MTPSEHDRSGYAKEGLFTGHSFAPHLRFTNASERILSPAQTADLAATEEDS